ncbi:unnamed protein product [Pedinophyceae sp. YPF-701]|nr:unnamed protein product [Pedinophyceae sp. YPF-701]
MSTRTFDIASRKRQEVERLKAEQLQQERDGIARWQAGLQEGAGGESDYESDEEDERRREAAGGAAAMPDHPDYYGRGHRHNKENEGDDNARKIEERVAAAEKFAEQELAREEEEERAARDAPARARARDDPGEAAALPEAPVPVRVLPPPRVREPVKLSFTPTEAPHLPMREKREKEIKEYRRKQAARGAIEDAVDVTERQPMFLKDKGDALLGRGNLQGALSAYNRALEIEPDLVPVLSNRSLCLLKMGLWGACVEDCGRALELTRRNWEDVDEGRCADANEAARVGRARSKLLCRRAHALASLQRVGEAIEDLEAARKILPSAEVDASLAELQASLAPLTPAEARARGDERLRLRDAEGAHAAYSTIVGLPKGDVGDLERAAALSGRAAACILMERFGEAVGDAGTGLALLVRGATGAEDVDVAPCASEDEMVERLACLKAGGGAAEGQDGGLVQWQVQDKLVARRAMALAHVRRYAEARADFAALAALREGRGDVAGAEAARADAGKVAEMLRQEDA